MQPRALIGLGAVALAVAVYTLVVLRPGPGPAAPAGPRQGAARPAPRADADARTIADIAQRVLEPPPEPMMRLPPAEARKQAEAAFETMMQTLEELADAGKRVPRARRAELYRNTNDAFAAYSAELDPADPADLQALEDANIRMKTMLHELGVRVPKRPLLQAE